MRGENTSGGGESRTDVTGLSIDVRRQPSAGGGLSRVAAAMLVLFSFFVSLVALSSPRGYLVSAIHLRVASRRSCPRCMSVSSLSKARRILSNRGLVHYDMAHGALGFQIPGVIEARLGSRHVGVVGRNNSIMQAQVQSGEDRFGAQAVRPLMSIAGMGFWLFTMCGRRIRNTCTTRGAQSPLTPSSREV